MYLYDGIQDENVTAIQCQYIEVITNILCRQWDK